MIKDDCLFCKIVQGQIPSSSYYEDNDFLVILDLFPNTKGASLVLPKQHVTSDVFKADFDVVHKALDAAKTAAEMLMHALKPSRVALVTEGILADHLHLKLYPLYKTDESVVDESDHIFFDKFPGYITTLPGPKQNETDLNALANEIKAAN